MNPDAVKVRLGYIEAQLVALLENVRALLGALDD